MTTARLFRAASCPLLIILLIAAQPPAKALGEVIARGSISGSMDADSSLENTFSTAKFDLDYSGQPATASKQAPVRTDPTVVAAIRKAGQYFRQRDFVDAANALRPAFAVAPDSIDLLNAKASILAESGSGAEARPLYQKIAAAEPGAFAPAYDLAELLLMDHRFEDARTAYQDLLARFPDSDLARFKIILIDILEKKRIEAGTAMAELKKRGPSPATYYAAAAEAFDHGDIGEEKDWIEEAEKDFGAGRQRIFYESLADFGFVDQTAYPLKQ
ncbi:MAG TPA: tetratricopeptide repeat protein [Chthoniobacteraceae bacterium]|jgi:tetratricopeptide (TPR) repeat protein|nr:tetratricopeptide repeat protein [Chthoniobacteraceae bacterium]